MYEQLDKISTVIQGNVYFLCRKNGSLYLIEEREFWQSVTRGRICFYPKSKYPEFC